MFSISEVSLEIIYFLLLIVMLFLVPSLVPQVLVDQQEPVEQEELEDSQELPVQLLLELLFMPVV